MHGGGSAGVHSVLVKHPFQKLSKALGKDGSLCKHDVSDSHMQAVIRGNAFLTNYENPASRIDNR